MSPPPPPPPPTFHSATPILPSPPNIPSEGPNGSLLLELFVYNGSPFSDHWAFFVRSSAKRSVGVRYHATGDVLNGFEFQIERSHDYEDSENVPTAKIPLQWIEEGCFDEEAMLNGGVNVIDTKPVCLFEATVHEVEAPGKSLGSASHLVQSLHTLCTYFG